MGILEGKVAIVTGAGKGLGVGEAMALAKEGAAVTVASRTLADVAATAKAIEDIGGRALAVKCDVRDQIQVNDMVAETLAKFGAVDILVNNAQIMAEAHPLEEWTAEEMLASYESGPLGSWYSMLACFPYMKKNGGRIINFCSVAGHGILSGYSGYSMAKEAIRALTRNAAREWGKFGITVNTISPAAMSSFVAAQFDTQDKKDALFDAAGFALRKFGDPEADVGRSVVFLAGPDAGYITGCVLSVDGGCAMVV